MTATSVVSPYRGKALAALNQLPPFSPVLTRLLTTLANEDTSFGQLASLIEKDTVLAGNVLRVVNSAIYGRERSINSVAHAISILGVERLRNIALSFSVNRVWRSVRTPRSFSVARFNIHSLATGLMADRLAQLVPTYYPEGAFVAGLFHDLGKLLLAITLADKYEFVLHSMDGSDRRVIETERDVLGTDHAELSAAAVEKWQLPEAIQHAIEHHHNPDAARCEKDRQFEHTPAELIHLADEIVRALGLTVESSDANPDQEAAITSMLEEVNLHSRASMLLRDFQVDFDVLRQAS